jgi:diaminohydroxyphosphoribosylaminopyrimidine deaminase/5-amino-6-(5-phosphoribosylamino)uracil reductase
VDERAAMTRALALAWRGWGRVAPNPMVGAVLLRDGAVVAEGWHAEFGGPHAEVAALAAGADPRGATCVVTLEPCAHTGKTPPCADALIAAGVARVVIAGRDPDPAARGGIERLRAAGVAVDVGAGARDAAALNAAFLWSTVRPERPFVAVKLATSFDGYVADHTGRSRWISGPEAREWVHWLRAGFDALGVGGRTAVADDPQLTVRGSVVPRVPPARVIFAGRAELGPEMQVFRPGVGGPAVVVAPAARAPTAERLLGDAGVRVLAADRLEDALRGLAELGIRSVLVEGGGRLVGALLDRGLVDRVYRITAPTWLGRGTPAFAAHAARALADAARWTVVERRVLGDDTLLVIDRELCLRAS